MSGWQLSLRETVPQRLDAQPLSLNQFRGKSIEQIARITLDVDGGSPTQLGELFTIRKLAGEGDRLVLEGELTSFDNIAADHHAGEFRVIGSVGDHVASAMTGGCLIIEGNAGDFTAAPTGARRSGMRGGRIVVTGSAGHYTGHRMRRGEVIIEGDAGDFTASHQVAGTIVIAGRLGHQPAYGMRRGSLLTRRLPELPRGRFSEPIPVRSVYPTLLQRSLASLQPLLPATAELMHQFTQREFLSMRGDAALAGQGEILAPG